MLFSSLRSLKGGRLPRFTLKMQQFVGTRETLSTHVIFRTWRQEWTNWHCVETKRSYILKKCRCHPDPKLPALRFKPKQGQISMNSANSQISFI